MASLIYELLNTEFNGIDDYIDTNVMLYDTNKDWIIFVDFTSDSSIQFKATIIDTLQDTGLYSGISIDKTSDYGTIIGVYGTIEPLFTTVLEGNRHRIALRKNSSEYHYIADNGNIADFTNIVNDGVFIKNVVLGAYRLNDNSIVGNWGGVIHKASIYLGEMTDDELRKLFNPTITIGTPSTTKISSVSGYDRATVTFQSDIPLQSWEARATLPGITPSHGVGLLVESGTSLAAGTNATVHVDDEELTNGDNEYTISIFGLSSEGRWSDA